MDESESGMSYPTMQGQQEDFYDDVPYEGPADGALTYTTMNELGTEEVSVPTPKAGGLYAEMPVPAARMPLKNVPGYVALQVADARLEDLPALLSEFQSTAGHNLTRDAQRNLSALVREANANRFDEDVLTKIQAKAAKFAGLLSPKKGGR